MTRILNTGKWYSGQKSWECPNHPSSLWFSRDRHRHKNGREKGCCCQINPLSPPPILEDYKMIPEGLHYWVKQCPHDFHFKNRGYLVSYYVRTLRLLLPQAPEQLRNCIFPESTSLNFTVVSLGLENKIYVPKCKDKGNFKNLCLWRHFLIYSRSVSHTFYLLVLQENSSIKTAQNSNCTEVADVLPNKFTRSARKD